MKVKKEDLLLLIYRWDLYSQIVFMVEKEWDLVNIMQSESVATLIRNYVHLYQNAKTQ